MATEFIAGLGIFNSLLDTAKGLKEINDVTIRNAAIIEIQEKIMAAQAQYLSLHQDHSSVLQNISDLEKKIASFETWESEKERYELYDIGNGTFIYRLKESEANGEPSHNICAHCYQQNKKSIFQFQQNIRGRHVFGCPLCHFTYSIGESAPIIVHNRAPL